VRRSRWEQALNVIIYSDQSLLKKLVKLKRLPALNVFHSRDDVKDMIEQNNIRLKERGLSNTYKVDDINVVFTWNGMFGVLPYNATTQQKWERFFGNVLEGDGNCIICMENVKGTMCCENCGNRTCYSCFKKTDDDCCQACMN